MSELIIHFGRQIANGIYDHRIDPVRWAQCLKSDPSVKEEHLHVYHIGSLTYEFDTLYNHKCFTDVVVNRVPDFKLPNTHIYYRQRTFYQSDFQPINQYYNIHEVIRTGYTCDDYRVLFEHKIYEMEHTYEVIVEGSIAPPHPPQAVLTKLVTQLFG